MKTPDDFQRAFEFVRELHDQLGRYHDHKERMAYVPIAAYSAAMAIIVFSKSWPTRFSQSLLFDSIAVSALLLLGGLIVLRFASWQLMNRQVAALRAAACQRLLARWVCEAPVDADYEFRAQSAESPKHLLEKFFQFAEGLPVRIWDLALGRTRITEPRFSTDVDSIGYPTALVVQFEKQYSKGTASDRNRNLVLGTHVLFVSLAIVRSWITFISEHHDEILQFLVILT